MKFKIVYLLLALAPSIVSAPPAFNRGPSIHFPAKLSARSILFYKGEPTLKIVDNKHLEVSIETLVPTIPGILYYGHIHPTQNLPSPRYRF